MSGSGLSELRLSVQQNPSSRLLRLALADYLAETGELLESEWQRYQVSIGQMPRKEQIHHLRLQFQLFPYLVDDERLFELASAVHKDLGPWVFDVIDIGREEEVRRLWDYRAFSIHRIRIQELQSFRPELLENAADLVPDNSDLCSPDDICTSEQAFQVVDVLRVYRDRVTILVRSYPVQYTWVASLD